MNRWIVVVLLVSNAPVLAQPLPTNVKPDADQPYLWHIALDVRPHPQMGPSFRQRLAADLAAALTPSLGKLGDVKVFDLAAGSDRTIPLIGAYRSEGFPALTKQAFRELTGIKTHFVRVELKSGVYRIEARQHDGSTGLTSPIIRTEETRSPDQVARLAGLMLFQDFGPVITIVGGSETDPTGLVAHARGAALAPLEKFIKPGDIFAVSLISRSMAVPERSSRGKPSTSAPARTIATVGTPREFTLLKAITSPKADGKFRVSVITRFETGLPATMSGLLGVRGLKLPAQSGPVAVRVLTEDGKPHPRASLINVMGTDGDYAVNPRPRDGFAYDPAAGVFRSPRPLSNVACLIVGLSPTYSQRFPVPVLGPEPIVVKFPIDEATARRAELEKASLALRLRIGEAHSALTTLFKAIGDLVSQQRNRDALDRLTDGIAAAVVADQSLTAELERVKKFPGANAGTAAGTLTDCEQQLKTFREYRDHLKQYEERLAAAAKLDPVRMEKELRAKDLASRIASLREQGEIPEALETYDELYELTKDDKFRVEKEKLARQWAPVDEEHRAAREVILIKWPVAQTLEDFIATTGPLNKAIDVLIKKKDVMGVRKALNSFNPAYAKIKGLVDPLDPTNAMDVEKLGQLNSISQELQLLANRAQDWLKKELAKK